MLIGKDIVQTKGYPITPYDRVYLDYGPNDKTEKFGKTNDGKPVMSLEDPTKAWEGIRPVKGKSVHSFNDLLTSAVNYFAQKYPGTKDKPLDPEFVALEAMSVQADLWVNSAIRQEVREPEIKQIDPAKAKANWLKNEVASGNCKTLALAEKRWEKYQAFLAAQAEDEESETEGAAA